MPPVEPGFVNDLVTLLVSDGCVEINGGKIVEPIAEKNALELMIKLLIHDVK